MSYAESDFAIVIERSQEIAAGSLRDNGVELNARMHSVMMLFLSNCELPTSPENLVRLGLAMAAGLEAFLEDMTNEPRRHARARPPA